MGGGQTDKMDVDHSQEERGKENERGSRGRGYQMSRGHKGELVRGGAPQATLSLFL